MNIGRINSTPAFKGNEQIVEYVDANDYEVIPSKDTIVINSTKEKKAPEETIMEGVKAATLSGVALKTGLTAGDVVAKKVENIAVQFCEDFADDAAKKARTAITDKGIKGAMKKLKNFSTTAITELPKRSKSLIKWGIGGTIAALLVYLGTKDANNDGKSDLLTAIKTFVNPSNMDSDFANEI